MKTYTIKDGSVIEVRAMQRGLSTPEVQASTKTEATAMLLAMAQQALSNSPRLYWRNGAILLTYPNGTGFAAEASTPQRASVHSGEITPLCQSQYPTQREASQGAGIEYYASEEYQAQATQQGGGE